MALQIFQPEFRILLTKLVASGKIGLTRVARLDASWNILCRIIPGFKQEMILVAEQHLLCHSVCRQVSQIYEATDINEN